MADEQESLFGSAEQPTEVRRYKLNDDSLVSARRLAEVAPEDQLDAMRRWFYENYEDPVQSCPYIGSDGGYQYIYGGPYDAREELEEEFSGIVSDDLIEELTDELNNECADWSGNSNNSSPDLDDYLYRSSAESLGQEDAFHQSAVNIERLLEVKVEPADRQCMLRLLYANVFTALETYLSDKFISSVNADEKTLRRFVETTDEFKKRRLALSEVFDAHESIKQEVQQHLVEVVWHRLDKVQPMFRDTLGINFPPDMRELHKALLIRHDCVHRSGKTKENGEERVFNEKDIRDLLSEADKLVRWIEAGGKEPPEPQPFDADLPF